VDEVFETYIEKPLLSFFSVVFIILGVFTMWKYQTVEVNTLDALLNVLTSNNEHIQQNDMMVTFLSNLFSAVGLSAIGIAWLFMIFRRNTYYSSVNNITALLTGLCMFGFSIIFINYVFSKLMILLIIGIVGALYISQKR
jgi:hypothetical protein